MALCSSLAVKDKTNDSKLNKTLILTDLQLETFHPLNSEWTKFCHLFSFYSALHKYSSPLNFFNIFSVTTWNWLISGGRNPYIVCKNILCKICDCVSVHPCCCENPELCLGQPVAIRSHIISSTTSKVLHDFNINVPAPGRTQRVLPKQKASPRSRHHQNKFMTEL